MNAEADRSIGSRSPGAGLIWFQNRESLRWIEKNAHRIEIQFDGAIMLCEGGFPLMETDEMNFEILKNASKALKRKSKFISSVLLWPRYLAGARLNSFSR